MRIELTTSPASELGGHGIALIDHFESFATETIAATEICDLVATALLDGEVDHVAPFPAVLVVN